ncbi:MAG: aspartate/glutamate racemase family protein [Betaproteobacteria bacterium]|nr:aspartate/glutamate racemase family protein [Betaproteobacteria bacterium]
MGKALRKLGVLGGMGPLATVDFLQKLIEETPATRDEEHLPVIVYSVPQIPERPPAITGNGPSPLPHMLEGIYTLKRAGVDAVAIACNTAHYWYDDLLREGGVPILHIADAACRALANEATRVGLIATGGTIAAGFYQQRFAALGKTCLLNSTHEQHTLVGPAIGHVKRGELTQAHALATRAAQGLLARGAQGIILGCTEIPLAIEFGQSAVSAHCIDATRALARGCVRWWQDDRD